MEAGGVAFNRTIRFPGSGGARAVSLAVILADYFSHTALTRGESYYLQGRVVITRGTPYVLQ